MSKDKSVKSAPARKGSVRNRAANRTLQQGVARSNPKWRQEGMILVNIAHPENKIFLRGKWHSLPNRKEVAPELTLEQVAFPSPTLAPTVVVDRV